MKVNSTNNVVGAVAFLAVTGIVVKILGLVCKVPLVYIIGEDGMGYFNSAYTIYNLFFILSSAGLPVAISILVCEEKQRQGSAFGIFKAILTIVSVLGILGALLLYFGAQKLAEWIGNEKSEICIAVMAPIFFFVCIAGGLRGYFQGLSRMVPTGISQLIEALCKAIVSAALALYGVGRGYSLPICAALALLGIAIGSFLSMLYLLILAFYNKENRTVRKYRVSARELIWRLLRIALPVTLGSLVLSLTNFIDLTLVMRGLQSGGMDAESANRLYGNYSSLAVPIFNMPSVFVMPIAYALVPLVTKARIAGNTQAQHMVAYNSLKAAGIVSMPFVFGMVLLSRPILLLLFERNAALRAAPLLSLLGPSVFFMGIVVITTSLLQACGKAGLPVWSMACGAVCKLVVSAVCIPKIGMMGAPIGTLGCYVVIAGMNVCFAVRYCELKLQVMNRFWSALVAGFGCALVGRLVYTLGTSVMGFRVSAFLSIVSSALVYGFVLFALGGIDCEDLEALPMPKVLKRLLGRFLFKKERKMHCENCFGVDKPTSLRL